jgi:asparagine synthase (glutamine-hydrolysing)
MGLSGIFCVYSGAGIGQDARPYLAALRRLSHRGPAGEGFEHSRDVFIGVRCPLTPAGAREAQPAVSSDGSAVALDGRLFNRDELARALAPGERTTGGDSDAALVLAAYARYGRHGFERLDGVWAAALWDARRHRLLLARDPVGVRPLYYYAAPRHLVVASEIKGILAYDVDAAAIDPRRVRALVQDGEVDDWTGTCFARIKPVPPGSLVEFHEGGTSSAHFWNLGLSLDGDPAAGAVLDALVRAVDRHTPDGVSVGVALSGGIDSSAIVGIATGPLRSTRRPIRAFSVNPPQTTDEGFLIDATVRRTGVPHSYVPLDGVDHATGLARLVDFHDEPIPYSGNFYQFELRRRMAEAGCRAVLVGYGADEIFAGYPHLAMPFLLDLAAHGRGLGAARFVRGARALLGSPSTRIAREALRFAAGYAWAFLARSLNGLAPAGRRPAPATAEADVLAPMPESAAAPPPLDGPVDAALRSMDRWQIFRRTLVDCFRKNAALLVRIEDRNAAAHGLDLCAPFMDVPLVRTALALPAHRYMEGGWNKAALRLAVRDLLAPEVLAYPQKLATPGNNAYVAFTALRPEFLDLLSSTSFRQSGLWSPRGEALYRADAARAARANLWFRVFVTQQWYERVVRRPTPESESRGDRYAL